MSTGMLWMAAGIAVVAWLPRLPLPAWLIGVALVGCILAACTVWRRYRYRRHTAADTLCIALGASLAGLVWGSIYGYHICSGLLPSALEQRSLLLSGRIAGLVEEQPGFARAGREAQPVLRFQFELDATANSRFLAFDVFSRDFLSSTPIASQPRLIQLNWYDAEHTPQPGERWQLRVKLKRPRGFANPGGFDYEAWLVANRIGATGYVERSDDNRKLADASAWSVDAWRGRAQHYLQRRLQGFAHRDLLLGLLLGDGGAIETGAWETFRATGTVHLFVVSGLQIAFTGGLALWFARLWWRSPWCASRRFNYVLGAVPALMIAFGYALLAGWGLPIQRALIMFAVLVWMLIARRQVRAATGWIAALWLVLLFDPLAVRDFGFWFSFIAVAAILLIVCGHRREAAPTLRPPLRARARRNAARWWRVQWALFATSLPLLLLLSGQLTWLALPANAIAIPLSTLVSLPLAFLALLADAVAPSLADVVWRGADLSLDILWRYLIGLQRHGARAIWHPRGIDIAICAFTALAAGLALLPRGTPGKAFAPIFLVPLLAPPLEKIAPGDYRVTVIDVGQGLSVLVETARHRLLYDAGALFGPERTVADLTVVPLLRRRGVQALDGVIISHNDSDHAGGWPAIARDFDVRRLLVGEPIAPVNHMPDTPAEFCRAGMRWRWDGIDFEILYPPPALYPPRALKIAGNDRSCVLQIGAGSVRTLLTGDIERRAEYALLENSALQPATLLLAPHHGSRSSSTAALIARVQPRYVVFSAGYLNRFKHPHPDIVDRYRQSGADMFDTAAAGAIAFEFSEGSVPHISTWRAQQRHYWN